MAACPRCGEANPARARFCLACGAPLEEPAAPREMRKTVTVVFSDVIDSTQLGEQLDAETYRRIISRYFIEVSRVLEHHGGTVEKFIGDAVMAVFGIPIVHEDDALRAVRAATELREALALLNAELRPEYGIELAVRTGINTGEVVAGDPGEGQAFATGEAVAVAQRLEATASPGEILMGEATQRLVRDAVLVEPVEPLTLKGKSKAVQAWRLLGVVTGAPAFARRLDSPLVGRERELALLEQAFRRAADERASHLFTVLGAAGVGKSRLVNELVSSLRDEARVLVGRCVPYGEGITFWPLTELVRQAAGITPRMSAEEARERLASLLSQEPEAELIVDRLTAATGLVEGDAKNEETFWAVRKLLEALAREGPLIAGFDDVQWAEPTFLDLLDHLADWTRNAPVFLICLARPELLDTRPDWGGGKLNATSILLEPLRAEDVELLIENLLEEGEAPEELLRALRDTGEGNPLFVEELLEMLIDRGALRRENGGWRTEGELEALEAPPTIQALLAARLDRLNENERDLVERAAVVGKFFSRDELVALLPEGASPGEPLSSLVQKDLIRPDRTEEDAFRFRHQLIRDAAYQGLAKESRAELHERFAAWLEQTRPGRLREHEEILGYHLEQAHRYRADLAPADERTHDLAARAAALLASAGRRAFSRGDMPAAVALLTRATLLLRDDEAGRLEVAPELARALVETGELARADAVLERTVEQAAAAGNRRVEWLARIARTQLQLDTDPERSLDELAEESEAAVAVFEELGDALGLASAWTSVAEKYWWRGRVAEMEPVLERALLYAREAGDERQAVFVLTTLLRAIPAGPRPVEDGLRRCRELLAEAGSDRTLESLGSLMIGNLEAMRGRFEEARSRCEHSRAVAAELGLTVKVASRSLYTALVALLEGDPSAAELELRSGYETLEAMGETGRLSTITALLAQTLYLQERFDEAERFTAVSEESASKDDLISHVMWKQTRAKLLARRGDQAAAEGLAREAVTLAESTDLLNIRGETLVDLAEVLRAGGQREDAAKAVEEAIALFEAKGNLVQTGRTRELLDALDRSSARR